MIISRQDIRAWDRIKRLNLINSVSGIKPANLIGTRSASGQSNLAIFSSVIHLGSDPPLLGMITRPSDEVRRHTFENIVATGLYTINHVQTTFVEKAHYTSAKFPKDVSEFDACQLTEEYVADFPVPFVQESVLKLGMRLREDIPIPLNGTRLLIGEVEMIILPDNSLTEEGYLNLADLSEAGISGLNSYYDLQKIADFPYARTTELPDFTNE